MSSFQACLLSRFHCQRVFPGLASPTFSWHLYLSCLTRLPSFPALASMSILSCFGRCLGLRSCLSSQMLYLVFLLPPCPVKLPSFPDFACIPWRLHWDALLRCTLWLTLSCLLPCLVCLATLRCLAWPVFLLFLIHLFCISWNTCLVLLEHVYWSNTFCACPVC
jgi:hypothetical protein